MTASRTRAVVLLGLAFGLGLFAGGAGMAVAARSGKVEIDQRGGNTRGNGPGWMRELDLAETQRDSIMGIYRRDGQGVDSLMRQIRPQTDSLYDLIRPEVDARRAETRRKVRLLLTPIQQERYDSMVQAYDAERLKMREQSRSGQGGPRANR
jgi:Spy/CpxP family protein refolding chaperone